MCVIWCTALSANIFENSPPRMLALLICTPFHSFATHPRTSLVEKQPKTTRVPTPGREYHSPHEISTSKTERCTEGNVFICNYIFKINNSKLLVGRYVLTYLNSNKKFVLGNNHSEIKVNE